MSIRSKVIVMVVAVGAMAAAEAPLLRSLQRATGAAREETDRRARVRSLSFQLELALVELGAESRAFLTGATPATPAALESLTRRYRDFEGILAALRALVRDPEQGARLEAIDRRRGEWATLWSRAMQSARNANAQRDVLAAGDTSLARVRQELAALRTRQDLLHAAAQADARRAADRAGVTIFAMSLVTIGVMLIAVLGLGRLVLNPLRAVAASATRISRGEDVDLPVSSRRDEIGALITAFTTMWHTVRAREEELSIAREQIAKEHAELLTITETVPTALVLIDTSGRIRSQNGAAAAFLGAPPPDEPPSSHEQRFTLLARDRAELPVGRSPITRALAGDAVIAQDLVVRTADGRETPTLVSAAPLRHDSGRVLGAVLVLQDVLALKAVERMKDEFVSTVSHELRTPLTSIRGSLQLVLDEPGSVPDDEHRELVGVALKNCERLIRIVNDILDIAKIKAGKTGLRVRACSVRELVHQAIESVADVARQRNVAFDVRVPDDLTAVDADPDRMIQVLVNLLSNAVKFSPANSRVGLEAVQNDGGVEIDVTDRGPGIPPGEMLRLFEKFHQVDSPSSRGKGGTGLGLAIARGLIEEHGGTIRAESRPGAGARFIFTIPAARPVERRV